MQIVPTSVAQRPAWHAPNQRSLGSCSICSSPLRCHVSAIVVQGCLPPSLACCRVRQPLGHALPPGAPAPVRQAPGGHRFGGCGECCTLRLAGCHCCHSAGLLPSNMFRGVSAQPALHAPCRALMPWPLLSAGLAFRPSPARASARRPRRSSPSCCAARCAWCASAAAPAAPAAPPAFSTPTAPSTTQCCTSQRQRRC